MKCVLVSGFPGLDLTSTGSVIPIPHLNRQRRVFQPASDFWQVQSEISSLGWKDDGCCLFHPHLSHWAVCDLEKRVSSSCALVPGWNKAVLQPNGVKMQAAQALLAISFIKPCRPLVALLLVQIWGYSLTWDNGLGSGWRHLDYWHGKDDLEHFLEGVQMLSGNDASDEMTSEGLIIQASPS